MNPLFQEALAAIVRWLLAFAAGWLVQHAVWTQARADVYVASAAAGIVALVWSLWAKYQARLLFLTALEAHPPTTEHEVTALVRGGLAPPVLSVALLALLLGSTACASARSTAIAADQTFSTAVFALDDAEYAACQSGALSVAQCARIDPLVTKALEDVKAVTRALKATPTGLPASLPALLQDLSGVQAALVRLQAIAPDVASKAAAADAAAIALLRQFAGGQ